MRVTKQFNLSLGRVLFAALALALMAPAASAADRVDPRIVNPERIGDPVPWQAAIVRRGDNAVPLNVFCGATIRDATHVITAAHCLDDSNAADLDIVVGFVSRWFPEQGHQRVPVSAITSHPAYDDASKRNDLAILTLGAQLRLGNQPGITYPSIGLPSIAPDAPVTEYAAIISGWGTTSSGGEQPDTLYAARVLVYPDAQCGGYGAGFDPSVMLCAGFTSSGGPPSTRARVTRAARWHGSRTCRTRRGRSTA